MRDKRVFATLIIWGAVMYFLQSLTGYSDPPFDGTVALVFMIFAALVSTIIVWTADSDKANKAPSFEADKAKRELPADVRLQLLLELLDEKEKARLKARLLNEFESNVADGEISLEMLLKR